MNKDTSHLSALEAHLSRERVRLQESRNDRERELRSVWVSQLEKEIEGEKKFLGIEDSKLELDLSDEELLKLLNE